MVLSIYWRKEKLKNELRRYRKQRQHIRAFKTHDTLVNRGVFYPQVETKGDWFNVAYHNGMIKKCRFRRIHAMRPTVMDKVPTSGYIFEPKFDGTRTMLYAQKGLGQAFINRAGVDHTNGYPELKDAYKGLKYTSSVILDGEIIAPKGKIADFKGLAERDHLTNPADIAQKAMKNPLQYIAFDIMEKDGKMLKDKPLMERKQILNATVPDNLEQIKRINYTGNYNRLAEQVKRQGGEGIVAKNKDSPYVEGKSKHWMKDKFSKMQDVVVVGYTNGTGKREGKVGAVLAGVYDRGKLRYAGKIGTGFTDSKLNELTSKLRKLKTTRDYIQGKIPNESESIFVKPVVLGRVKFSSLTSNGIMREPRWQGERSDIKPKEAHREVYRR